MMQRSMCRCATSETNDDCYPYTPRILLLLTALASGGYWVSRGEMGAAQGYSQSARALYMAESGLARFFAMNPTASADTVGFELYPDLCADTIAYPTASEQAQCYIDDDSEEEELLEGYELSPPPAQAYAFMGGNVYVTSEFILTDGQSPIYLVRSEARVDAAADPGLYTVRVVDTYARVVPPFEITTVFAATGGVDFGGVDQHHHFDSKAKAGKTGACGSDEALPALQIPSGQMSLPLPHADCPAGKDCPYKWHMKGDGEEVDSAFAVGSQIVDQMGMDWGSFLADSMFAGVPGVILLDNSEDFEDYFDKSKDKAFKGASSWPIVRYTGDIDTDRRVKGYGILIVDGDVLVSADKIEWTGIMLVGGTISTIDDGHIHVKGAAVAGLGCTDLERAAGSCRSVLNGEHNDFKYRPCEVNQAWTALMYLRPIDDLFREASPGW